VFNYNFSMDNVDVKMTISCGLAEYPQDSDKMNELIAKADDAMYAAKAQGGNMVSVFSEESSDIQSESI